MNIYEIMNVKKRALWLNSTIYDDFGIFNFASLDLHLN